MAKRADDLYFKSDRLKSGGDGQTKGVIVPD